MRGSMMFGRIAAMLVIVTWCSVSARSQTSSNGDQTSMLSQLENNIRSAVENGHYINQTEVYKDISIGLARCAMTYQIHSEASKDQSARDAGKAASNLFFNAAIALYPGDAQSGNQAMEESKGDSLRILSDKGLFFFLLNCDHLLKSSSAENALSELLAIKDK